ncbi:MAG: pantetheine-phosphate adenylyltransferase [Acidimicrobiia bacterium]|nr:pantetheine-phosphate adenylyltransferase [Acidimicrobiia bacterium]MDH3471186.1 pantetheine-phosphate adenylyltransferase [Acidimicrobiia bacterium]
MSSAVVPGSFDPPTNGHVDVIARAASVFDEVTVAVLRNPNKTPLFSLEERIAMLKEAIGDGVAIGSFDGLLVDFARDEGIDVIVKGLRAITDFDYELQMAQMNRKLSGIVTFFVATKPEYGYLSSSLVKEVAKYGSPVDDLVPAHVAAALKERLS